MIQSTSYDNVGLHVGVIMDGNGRWARRRGLARSAGHRKGAEAARRAVRAAPGLGISVLTLFAFSSANWQRPPSEVGSLMLLLERFLEAESPKLVEQGVRLDVIGRRDRLQPVLRRSIARAEAATAECSNFLLRLALDYSARHAIEVASRFDAGTTADPAGNFAQRLDQAIHADLPTQPVDLVLRTGGEQRLSDFLLWEAAYAELLFLSVLWPDFSGRDLEAAIQEFRRRDRRFGRLSALAS